MGLAALLAVATPAAGQEIVTSAGPASVSVTLYRAPNRSADEAIDRSDPEGFALITETRTVRLPAGRSTIRFEGVAGNIFPETAIVAGLPSEVREKNLDADLLSPRSLYDRALGRRVLIRRTNPATGKLIEQQATIRSSADGAAVVQIAGGYEALRCGGLPEAVVYDGVPGGLSPKPTLSIETASAAARDVTLTLSYLAGGFDWQADYVVRMRPDGRGADLFAWVTLASSDVTSFTRARAQVVAGKPNRVGEWHDFGDYRGGALALKCWPLPALRAAGPPPPPPPAPMAMMVPAMEAADIIVTAARRAVQEELGDFKLYRIVDPVTVASKAQKQVALLSKDAVPMAVLYVSDIISDMRGGGAADPVLTLRAHNRVADGLGLPLPAGLVAVFEDASVGNIARPILVGESHIDDKAVGEDVEFKLGDTVGVAATVDVVTQQERFTRYRLTVTNANPWGIAYESKIRTSSGASVTGAGARLGRRDGAAFWAIAIPANGMAVLEYRVTQPR